MTTTQRGLVLTLAVLAAASAGAQGPVTFELSFSNPGARSLGFGGAFAALADDATAAFANPAGLVQLTVPEVSAEGRAWSYATPYTAGGRFSGEPSGIGLDTASGPLREISSRDPEGLSFLSFVYPRRRWSLALYRHQLARFEFRGENQGLFGRPNFGAPGVLRDLSHRTAFDFYVVSHGLAAGWRVTDELSLGVGVARFDTAMDLILDEYAVDSSERFFEPVSFLPERLLASTTMTIDAAGWGLAGGFLWRFSERFTAGGFFRQGAEGEVVIEQLAGPLNPSGLPVGTVLRITSPVALPDVYGLGVALHAAGGRLTVTGEWDRVEYSTLLDSFDPEVFVPDQRVDDGDELRLGGEWVFLGSRPLAAVRLGVWLDPDHQLRSKTDDPLDRALFPEGEDELHLAAGFGIAFPHFQIDAAVDFSELVDTASISAIYRF